MSAYQLAQKYYPVLWPIERLQALLEAGRLTQDEYDTLTATPAETA